MTRALALALLLAGCQPAPPTAEGGARPTIVSLNPCSDAVLAEVAAPGQLLAISAYSQRVGSSSMDLAIARRFPAVGEAAEEVFALRPDVVVASPFLPRATAEAIRARGIRLVALPIATSIAESKAQVADLAALAGQPRRGAALNARIDAALAAAVPPRGAPRVRALVWQAGGIVPGAETLITDLLARTGFASHSAALGLKQADYLPLERVIAEPPELILAAGDPRVAGDRLLAHPALARIARTERLDPSLLWCGGPTIIRAAARLAAVREAR